MNVERDLVFVDTGRRASRTVAVNGHAQFKPHTDQGTSQAGANSTLIVGLGEVSPALSSPPGFVIRKGHSLSSCIYVTVSSWFVALIWWRSVRGRRAMRRRGDARHTLLPLHAQRSGRATLDPTIYGRKVHASVVITHDIYEKLWNKYIATSKMCERYVYSLTFISVVKYIQACPPALLSKWETLRCRLLRIRWSRLHLIASCLFRYIASTMYCSHTSLMDMGCRYVQVCV